MKKKFYKERESSMEIIVLYAVLSVVVGCIGIWRMLEWRRLDREEAEEEARKAEEAAKQ